MGRLEQKDIRYRGYSTLPDDYQVVDGAIAFATNAVYEDGGLKVLQEAKPLELLVAEGARIYIHHTVNYYHYIIVYQTYKTDEAGNEVPDKVRLYVVDREVMDDWLAVEGHDWVDAIYHKDVTYNNMTEGVVDFLYECEGEFVSLVAVANTLVVSTKEEMYYFLCKPGGVDDGQSALTCSCEHEYIFLGNKVPSVAMEFGLGNKLEVREYDDTLVDKTDSSYPNGEDSGSDVFFTPMWSTYVSLYAGETVQYTIPAKIEGGSDKLYRIRGDVNPYAVLFNGYVKMFINGQEFDSSFRVGYRSEPNTFRLPKGEWTLELEIHPGTITGTAVTARGMLYLDQLDDFSLGSGLYYVKYDDENYDAVLGCINQFVKSYGREANKFIHPFFVRYAIRLYDESLCAVSPPILMMPNSGCVPFAYTTTTKNDYDLILSAFVGTLRYKTLNAIDENWRDIISGISVYVSQPIYPYDQGKGFDKSKLLFTYKTYIGNEEESLADMESLSYGYGTLNNQIGVLISENYKRQNLFDVIRDNYGLGDYDTTSVWRITMVAPKDEETFDKDICSVSNFYLLANIDIEELFTTTSSFEELKIEGGVLSSLEGREALSEDVIAYDSFIGVKGYSYNYRLHTFGGNGRYHDVLLPTSMMQYIDAVDFVEEAGRQVYRDSDGMVVSPCPIQIKDVYVYIRTTAGTKMVHTNFDESIFSYSSGCIWLFYPHNQAYMMKIGFADTVYDPDTGQIIDITTYISLNLKEHDYLNGAYHFERSIDGLFHWIGLFGSPDYNPPTYPTTIELQSIYVSEVNNPFVFRNSSAVTVGSGRVLALSSAAQAMSQGQFGQYPLYAFTEEGIWALSVQTDGTYGTSQPIARDVVTNVASITQLDSSVLFVTDRGIMEIAGSKVACISEGIDGEWGEFNPLVLPYFAELYLKYVEGVVEGDEDYEAKKVAFEAMVNAWSEERFFNFIKTCRMVYDYVHQRILVYNGERSIGYNYSLESKEWSLMFSELRYSVNSYPEALALEKVDDAAYGLPSDEEHWGLVNMSEYVDEGEEEEDVATEMFVTRPFKLDAPDVFKTVDSVVQRGYFQQSAKENHIVGTVLYGSPDLFNWYIVGQSATVEVVEGSGQYTAGHIIDKMQGSPYKYFRVAVLCRLGRRETICGCSMLYELKDNNMLR